MRNKRLIIYIIIFVPFFFNAILALEPYNYFVTNNTEANTSFLNFILSKNIYKKLLQLSLFFLPIITLTFAELILFKSKLSANFKSKSKLTSLGKIYSSKGFPFADIWYFTIGFFLSRLIPFPIAILTLGAASLNSRVGEASSDFLNFLIPSVNSQIGCTVALLLAISVEDLSQYLNHRLEHGIPFLWQLHEFHHSASEMTILSNYRNTELVSLFTFPILAPAQALFGLLIAESLKNKFIIPLFIFLTYGTMVQSFRYLAHSSLKISFPKPFSYIFMSPSLHLIHHSDNPKHFDSNFSVVFTFWDRLFGTYKGEEHVKEITGYGISNSEYNMHHPLYSYFVIPLKRIFEPLKKHSFKLTKYF